MADIREPSLEGSPATVSLSALLRASHGLAGAIDQGTVDWRARSREAMDAWLGGVLMHAAERHGWNIPHTELMQLRWQALQIRRRNVRLMDGLARLSAQLREHDIDVLALKGAALNLTYYEALDLRPMSDLDLMVRQKDAVRAVEVLTESSCRRGHALVRPDFFPRFHYETELETVERNPIRIDLHARPFRPLRCAATIPKNGFWEGSASIEIGGTAVRILAVEEQLIHLAAHSAFHGHCRLLWLYDLCRLIDTHRGGINWHRVVEIAQRFKLVLPVRSALGKVVEQWPGCVPQDVVRSLESIRVGMRDRLTLYQSPRDAFQPIRHIAVNTICASGVRFRLAYLLRSVLPSAEHMGESYRGRHRGWLACAYFWRIVRAVSRNVLPGRSRKLRMPAGSSTSSLISRILGGLRRWTTFVGT